MTSLTPWDPFPDMRELMQRFGAGFDRPGLLRGQGLMPDFPVEVSETDSDIVVKASLPGVESKDIQISVQANSLTIKAESKEEVEQKDQTFLRREMSYGSMQRSFALPTEVDAEKSVASFENGVLRLKLPKAKASSAHQIQVK